MVVRTKTLFAVAMLCCIAGAWAYGAGEDTTAYDIPKLDGIRIDGNASDWGEQGFRVDLMADAEGNTRQEQDFNVRFRLGWNAKGLLVLAAIQDDVFVESGNMKQLWEGDGIEFYAALSKGSAEYYHAQIAPGMDNKCKKLRQYIEDYRKSKAEMKKLSIQAVRIKTEHGYLIETLLPWSNLGITPAMGTEVGLQVCANDYDADKIRTLLLWYPKTDTYQDSSRMYALRLAEKPSPSPFQAAAHVDCSEGDINVRINAVKELAGSKAVIRTNERELGAGTLMLNETRATAGIVFPFPALGTTYGTLSVAIEGQPALALEAPESFDELRAKLLTEQNFCFAPGVFSGEEFPKCDFEKKGIARALLGAYTIKTTFYDNAYNEVKAAASPGRYAAVCEIIPEKGQPIRRFRTLLRTPEAIDGFKWWRTDMPAAVSLPKELGISKAALDANQKAFSEYVKWRIEDSTWRDPMAVDLFAALFEQSKAGTSVQPDYAPLESRQWWVGLKRKLYGTAELYPNPFIAPRPIEGAPAPVLHEGSEADAGMKSGTVAKLDKVCEDWAANSEEAFAVFLVRHGVVFYHKAFGMRDGKPMTVDTPSWMASITKTMSASLMMMLVDQGLVSLDDPVDKFLPPFRGITVEKPLTVHHLYTHTNGLWGHWGDDLNDFEEVLAGYYPYLPVGKQHMYNGAGNSLGSKIVEAVSGESLPLFYKHHLLDPLGCTHTKVDDSSGGSDSTPMDIARIGQMLLNKGAYGDKRFFSEDTYKQMLPQKLTQLLGPDTSIVWGMGLIPCGKENPEGPNLSDEAFGHGAASAAIFCVDPVNDLVVVMTRDSMGKAYPEHRAQFFKIIAEGF